MENKIIGAIDGISVTKHHMDNYNQEKLNTNLDKKKSSNTNFRDILDAEIEKLEGR